MARNEWTGAIIGLAAVGVAGFIAYKWLNPSTSTPTANNPFPGAGQIPIVPEDYHYVNPILCALGAKDFCPVATVPTQGACVTNPFDIHTCPGGFNYNRGADGCIYNVECV